MSKKDFLGKNGNNRMCATSLNRDVKLVLFLWLQNSYYVHNGDTSWEGFLA